MGSSIFNMIAVFFPSSFLLTLHCSFHMNCAFWKQIKNMPSARYILLRKNHCICFVTLKIFYFAGMRYFACRRFISFWICWVFITSNGSSSFLRNSSLQHLSCFVRTIKILMDLFMSFARSFHFELWRRQQRQRTENQNAGIMVWKDRIRKIEIEKG